MLSIEQTLFSLEQACDSEEDLISYTDPHLNDIIEAIKTLPAHERDIIRERLNRVETIIEGKMMMYAEELQSLGTQIRNVATNSAAASAYRTVAVFPIKPSAN